jgi:hypothetical protein
MPSVEDRKALARHLIQYRKVESQWDDYRKKLPDVMLKQLADITAEMRRNGFFSLGAEARLDDKLRFTWAQATDNRVKEPIIPGELCDACEKSCKRKEKEEYLFNCHLNDIELIDKEKEPVKPCWAE